MLMLVLMLELVESTTMAGLPLVKCGLGKPARCGGDTPCIAPTKRNRVPFADSPLRLRIHIPVHVVVVNDTVGIMTMTMAMAGFPSLELPT